MFCKFCGSKIDDNSLFCSSCGKKLDDSDSSFQSIQANQMSEPSQSKILSSESFIPYAYDPKDCKIRMNYVGKRYIVLAFIIVILCLQIISLFLPFCGISPKKIKKEAKQQINEEYGELVGDLAVFFLGDIYDKSTKLLNLSLKLFDKAAIPMICFISIIIALLSKDRIDSLNSSSLDIIMAINFLTLGILLFLPVIIKEILLSGNNDGVPVYTFMDMELDEESFRTTFSFMSGYYLIIISTALLFVCVFFYQKLHKSYVAIKETCLDIVHNNPEIAYGELKREMGNKESIVDLLIYEGVITVVEENGKSKWEVDHNKILTSVNDKKNYMVK